MELQEQHTLGAERSTLMILGTSIATKPEARRVRNLLYTIREIKEVSIDLDDWEHVLRITFHIPISFVTIQELLQSMAVHCYELPE